MQIVSNINVILICITSLVGMFGVSASLQGYFMCNMSVDERLISAVGGLLLIYPGWQTDVIGIVLVGSVFVLQLIKSKKNKTPAIKAEAPEAA